MPARNMKNFFMLENLQQYIIIHIHSFDIIFKTPAVLHSYLYLTVPCNLLSYLSLCSVEELLQIIVCKFLELAIEHFLITQWQQHNFWKANLLASCCLYDNFYQL